MSLHKQLHDLFDKAAQDPSSLTAADLGDGADLAAPGDPRLTVLYAAILRLASTVDELQNDLDELRARYG